jgi:hypothetical protein
MAQINDAAVGRLNASPATTKSIQRQLGLPETGQWDETTDNEYAAWAKSMGYDPNFGMDNNATNWNTAQAALAQRAPDTGGNPAMEDPAYAAYLRTMGIQQADIKNEIIARTTAVQDAINRNAAGYGEQKATQTKNAGLDFQSRGLGNSGAQYQAQDKAVADVTYQQNQDEAAQRDALQVANRNSQQALSQLGQKRAEMEFDARSRIGQKRAQQTYNPLGAS